MSLDACTAQAPAMRAITHAHHQQRVFSPSIFRPTRFLVAKLALARNLLPVSVDRLKTKSQ
jgi:hypothetical protein